MCLLRKPLHADNHKCLIIQYRLAEEKKESGNHLYKFKNYKGALTMYDEAVKLCPENPAYLGNRAAAYMMLGMYKKALEDAQKAVALDSTFTKGYIRIAKCCLALGKSTNHSCSYSRYKL